MAIATGHLTITPLHPLFAAEVLCVDLTRPLYDATFDLGARRFRRGFRARLPRTRPSPTSSRWRSSQCSGPLDTTVRTLGKEDCLGAHMVDLSNVGLGRRADGLGATAGCCTSWVLAQAQRHLVQAAPRAFLGAVGACRAVGGGGGRPSSSSTARGLRGAARCSAKRVDGRVVVHSFGSRAALIDPGIGTEVGPEALPPRACLWQSRWTVGSISHSGHTRGASRAWASTRADLDRQAPRGHARPDRVFRHSWRVGDLVMWDNRCVLHRGRPWDSAREKRVMHRTTVAGDGPTAHPGVRLHEL